MTISSIGTIGSLGGLNSLNLIGSSKSTNSVENNQVFSLPDGKQTTKNSTGIDNLLGIIKGMNNNQVEANTKMSDVLTGKSDDASGALVAIEKSSIEMELASTVRDKLVTGYNTIINMQI